MEKKTPLYEEHLRAGAKWCHSRVICCRSSTARGDRRAHGGAHGLRPVRRIPLGEVLCAGPGAVACLNRLLTNDYTVMYNGQARYSPMCSEQGGVVDDLIVCKVRDECYFIVVNAANKEKDVAWMRAHAQGDVQPPTSRTRWPAGAAGARGPGHPGAAGGRRTAARQILQR